MTDLMALTETFQHCYAHMTPYADNIQVTCRQEIVYWTSPWPSINLNKVRQISASCEQFPRLVDEVRQAHFGKPSSWDVASTVDAQLSEILAKSGYEVGLRASGLSIDCTDAKEIPTSTFRVELVRSDEQISELMAIDSIVFEGGRPHDSRERASLLDQSRCCRPNNMAFLVYEQSSNRPVACGRLCLFPDLKFGLLQRSGTLPDARFRGAYSALLQARISFASRRGIRRLGLYADQTTSAPILLRRGFQSCGAMTRWQCESVS